MAGLTDAQARLDTEYATVKINGQDYPVPLGNDTRTQDVYYLKKAVEEGDKTARSIFLGGSKTRAFYAGDDETKVWIFVKEDGQWVQVLE